MGWGLFGVGVLAVAVFVAVQVWANAESDTYDDRSAAVAEKNMDITVENLRLPASQERAQLSAPERPLVVRYTGWVAAGAALIVAVVGSIVVLLFTIATGQRRA